MSSESRDDDGDDPAPADPGSASRRGRGRRRPRIGLALGSGAARGWAHIGVIRALADAGITPDVVCGSSMGALVGAAHVTGHLDELESWARRITWRGILGFLDVKLGGGGLIEGRRIRSLFQRIDEKAAIEDFPTPFAAVATDLATGREVWIRRGSIVEAVRASIALPGVLSPVRHGGEWLIDGGVVNPVPVSACRALGAEVIIAVNLNGEIVGRHGFRRTSRRGDAESGPPGGLLGDLPQNLRERLVVLAAQMLGIGGPGPGYFDVVFGAINIMQDRITRSRLAGEPPDVMILPRLADLALLEFHRADEAIAEGRRATESAMPAIRAALS